MSHFVQLTDEHDNFLGHKQRNELSDEDTWRIIAIDIHDPSDNHILIQKRSLQKKLYPWAWSVAIAGTVENDDTYESCALREMEEELKIVWCHLEVKERFFYKADLGYRQCMTYATRIPIDTPLVLQESEVRWVSQVDLKEWIDASPWDFTGYSLKIWKDSGII